MVLSLFKKETSTIGVDLGSSYLKMAQLSNSNRLPLLLEAGSERVPEGMKAGSPDWQKWAVRSIKKMLSEGTFKSRTAISTMSSDDIYIQHVKISKNEQDIERGAFESIKKKLPFNPDDAMVQCVCNDAVEGKSKRDVLVMAADKVKVERHLAIFEKAGLNLKSMSVWPLAITRAYINFFARRTADSDLVAMLLDIGANHSNIIMTKHSNLLFARVIPLGFNQLKTDAAGDNLLAELAACLRYFESMETGLEVGKLLFLSGRNVDKTICEKVAILAKQMHIPAQIGDVLAAVEVNQAGELLIDRRGIRQGWTTAFGLSLSD